MSTPVDYQFQNKSKFALLTVNNVYTELPDAAFQLSDGTWVMPGVPVPDLGIWKEWIGSIRMESLSRANLVLFVEEPSHNPEIVDEVHQLLDKGLSDLCYRLHLRAGIEVAEGADLLCGSSLNGVPGIRQMSQMPAFQQSKGWQRAPITKAWLEDGLVLRAGVAAMDADKTTSRESFAARLRYSKACRKLVRTVSISSSDLWKRSSCRTLAAPKSSLHTAARPLPDPGPIRAICYWRPSTCAATPST